MSECSEWARSASDKTHSDRREPSSASDEHHTPYNTRVNRMRAGLTDHMKLYQEDVNRLTSEVTVLTLVVGIVSFSTGVAMGFLFTRSD